MFITMKYFEYKMSLLIMFYESYFWKDILNKILLKRKLPFNFFIIILLQASDSEWITEDNILDKSKEK